MVSIGVDVFPETGSEMDDPTVSRSARIRCACGKEHRLSPTAVAACLQAFIDGYGMLVTKERVILPMCLLDLIRNMPDSALIGRRVERINAYE